MNVAEWYQTEDVEPRQWYSVQNSTTDPKSADVEIYDDIIPFFGANAADFRSEIKALGDVETINLHVHSRGGNVYEAVAMMNTLRQHDAKVITTVDSIAASAAGFIAVGASDELVVAENAEIMAHLPWALVVGDANDMRKQAERLEQIANNIASIFAEKAGGTVDEWMQVLTDETWWSAQEAVDAGVADRVLKAPKRKTVKAAGAKNLFDLSVFNHAGRSDAPAPRTPQAHNETPQPVEAEGTQGKESTVATLSESALQKLGLDADADEAAVNAAIDRLADKAPTVTDNAPPAEPSAEQLGEVAAKLGAIVVDKAVHDKLVADAEAGAQARAQQVQEAHEATIQNALRTGKIDPANAPKWREELEKSPETVTNLLAAMPENKLPVSEIGHGVTREDAPEDSDKADMFAMVTGRTYGEDI